MKHRTYSLPFAVAATAVIAAMSAAPAQAADDHPFLDPLFTDNMVLQRDRADAIWGWTTPGATVNVAVGNLHASAVAAPDGKWMARIGPLKAGGPYTVQITGPQNVTLSNVLAGDVWICSGQSNMEFGIGNSINAQQEIADANYPEIRLFTVPKRISYSPVDTVDGHWDVCTPATVAAGGWNGFTAVGYFFGRDLYKATKIPIGLIHTSWGGTVAQAWTSESALETMPDFRQQLAQVDQVRQAMNQGPIDHAKAGEDWYAKYDAGSGASSWAAADLDTADWKAMTLPTSWEDAGLPDFDGVVWFRKEFDLPVGAEGKDLVLFLGPIDDNDTTFVNGVRVGATEGYNIPRKYTVPASALHAGHNVIAVRVLDTGGAGGVNGQAPQLHLDVPGGDSVSLAGEWRYKVGADYKKIAPYPSEVRNDPNVTTVLYNGMIAPLIPYGIRGAIWYQGESNAGAAYQYRTLLPTMIGDWRTRWGEGKFPFYIVQLANWQAAATQPGDDAWAELREAQTMTANTVGHSGEALAIDIGDAADIHPKNKQEVGRRLSLVALHDAYGRKLEYSGPVYKSMRRDGSTVRIQFSHTTGGLKTSDGGPLKGFAIAGPDHHFAWADAKIEGDSVVVSAAGVQDPASVRYAWAINPVCNLVNGEGLPAVPFRTDTWKGITQH
jgi:sialate O-acetylesterase